MGHLLPVVLLAVVKLMNLVYDLVTLPLYFLAYRPWAARQRYGSPKSVVVRQTDKEVLVKSVFPSSNALVAELEEKGVDTLYRLFEFMTSDPAKSDRESLGTRTVISATTERDEATGKAITKLSLGEYRWITNRVAGRRSTDFGKALREMGVAPGSRLALYADTRADWMLTVRGCFQHAVSVVTLYTNLGIDAVKYGIGQTEACAVVTSQELLPKLCAALADLPRVFAVIVLEEPWRGDLPATVKEVNPDISHDVRLVPYLEMLEIGAKSDFKPAPPKPDDPAVIMYTSGSTGVPKGVIQTHKNLIAAFKSTSLTLRSVLGDRPLDKETYVAFLPLAHILEFLAENVFILMGMRVGYSTPFTLTDAGTMIKKGSRGDLCVLKPSVMVAVPLVLDRIYKGIVNKVKAKGEFSSRLFDRSVEYSTEWRRRGYGTPLLDRLIFKKVREATGGNLMVMVSGGAPLSGATQDFLRSVLGVRVIQGYGLTETCATCLVQGFDDVGIGAVGGPFARVEVKLRSWQEGGYTVSDSVGPRGEIIAGGDHVAEGYYKMPKETEAEFETEDGKRWFRTGDIGHLLPNGSFKIIDRRKDLVKLQMGEYVSLGKVETVLKLHPLVDNLCVCASPMQFNTVALLVPARDQFFAFCREKLGKPEEVPFTELYNDHAVLDAVIKSLSDFGLASGLLRFEIPRKVAIVLDEWIPESGLVTAALKLKRKQIDEKYSGTISNLYKELEASSGNTGVASVNKAKGKVSPV